MADSRCSVEIKFKIYGKEFKEEFWINWYPDPRLGNCDRRVVEWFCHSHEEAYHEHQLALIKERKKDLSEDDPQKHLDDEKVMNVKGLIGDVVNVCGIPEEEAVHYLGMALGVNLVKIKKPETDEI